MNTFTSSFCYFLLTFCIAIGQGRAQQSAPSKQLITVTAEDFKMMINESMRVKITTTLAGSGAVNDHYQNTDYVVIDEVKIDDFILSEMTSEEVKDARGKGIRQTLTGKSKRTGVKKTTTYTYFPSIPSFIFTQTNFTNTTDKKMLIGSWNTNHVTLKNTRQSPAYYAFQGSSTAARTDWIRPIEDFYYDKNYMGMNNSDYGGGIPVVDLWRPDVGIAIGHIALKPQLVSFPTTRKNADTDASICMMQDFVYPTWFEAGETLSAPPAFYTVHQGDYFQTLRTYGKTMEALGIKSLPSATAAFEPVWCAWGYERNFTKAEVLGTLDKVKELGIKWAVIDDGYQVAEGNWNLDKKKFPRGNTEMKEMVDAIHDKGLKAKIWWTPLAADPGSKVLEEYPKAIIYTEEWTPQFITWWDSYYLSPTNAHTVKHTKNTIELFMKEWGFDGLKMDGQHMNAVPPDHNPEAGIEDPITSTERLPDFFQMIYDEATAIKPEAVIENCPCGTCMSYFNMPSMNQAVSSDPLSSWQIRHKGKTYKALIPQTAYYGDHVELSDNASDFASSMGIGAVLGTKFTYPKDNPTASESFLLTPEKEEKWKLWFDLYNTYMISKGEYLGGLYDIGYDKPETHVIHKDDSLYYAFYAENWTGELSFRGTDLSKSYRVYDYVNKKELGTLKAGQLKMIVAFENNLLVQLIVL